MLGLASHGPSPAAIRTVAIERTAGGFGTSTGYVLVWLAAAILWSLAAIGGGGTPGDVIPVAAAQTSVAAVLGLGVWRLTGAVQWQPRAWKFPVVHALAVSGFATGYTAAQGVAFIGERPLHEAIGAAMSSQVTGWNLLIGGFIYVAIAGVSYARRAEASLREAERARAEAMVSARDAQLAALQAQLQPHFLFNALHTVGALLHTDPDRADRALDELGRMLRYALREPGEDVSLAQEWEFTRDYLAFESLRLGTRLRLDIEVDERALTARVPPLVLQPLVENAVRCGASDRPEGGAVAISMTLREPVVEIVVRNTVHETPAAGMSGSGLRRLEDRLKLRYGPERAGVLPSHRDGGFTVTITLPADDESDA